MADISLYEAIARNLNDIVAKGTPTGATATTADSNSFLFKLAEQLQGRNVYIYEGQGAGQSRTITVFDPANNRITIEPDWSTVPTANSRHLVFKRFKAEDYEHHMNRAMGKIALNYLSDMVASTGLAATQYHYVVPSGMEWIGHLRIVPTSGTDFWENDESRQVYEFPLHTWHIEKNVSGTYVISIDPRHINLDNYDKEILLIQGQGRPDFVATVIPSDLEEFIIADATLQMSARMKGRGAEWDAIYYLYKDEVKGTRNSEGLEAYIFKHGYGKKVKS